jgi:hypothetical protein
MPVRLKLQIGWNVPGHFVPLKDEKGNKLGALIVDGPTLLDPTQHTVTSISSNVAYGDSIALTGYSLSNVSFGSTLEVTLRWRYLRPMTNDYVAAVGLMDSNNKNVVQADGPVAGYPTSAWRPGPDFTDIRKLAIPANLPPGNYTFYVGWYDLAGGNRLTARGEGVNQALNIFEVPITIH